VKNVRNLAIDLEDILSWVKGFGIIPLGSGHRGISSHGRVWRHRGQRCEFGIQPGPGRNVVETDDGDVVFTTDSVDFIRLRSSHDEEEQEKKEVIDIE
jgi:hypothetical protein